MIGFVPPNFDSSRIEILGFEPHPRLEWNDLFLWWNTIHHVCGRESNSGFRYDQQSSRLGREGQGKGIEMLCLQMITFQNRKPLKAGIENVYILQWNCLQPWCDLLSILCFHHVNELREVWREKYDLESVLSHVQTYSVHVIVLSE